MWWSHQTTAPKRHCLLARARRSSVQFLGPADRAPSPEHGATMARNAPKMGFAKETAYARHQNGQAQAQRTRFLREFLRLLRALIDGVWQFQGLLYWRQTVIGRGFAHGQIVRANAHSDRSLTPNLQLTLWPAGLASYLARMPQISGKPPHQTLV